jgi:hypothetical protein
MRRRQQILPGTGRGTIRRMVEGPVPGRAPLAVPLRPLHPDAARRGSPPRSGEDLNEANHAPA